MGRRRYDSNKPCRVTWLEAELLLTAGFTKTRNRKVCSRATASRLSLRSLTRMDLQLTLWDARSTAAPLHAETLDASPAMLIPLYDADSKVCPPSSVGAIACNRRKVAAAKTKATLRQRPN